MSSKTLLTLAVMLYLAMLVSASPHRDEAHTARRHNAVARSGGLGLTPRNRSNSQRCQVRVASSTFAAVPVPTTSSSIALAPATSAAPRPPPPQAPEQPPPQSSAPAPSQPGGTQPSFMTGTQTGNGTFYATGLGACGITNTDSDFIAAVSHVLFDTFPGYDGSNPNNNPVCNRRVTASWRGKSVSVAITDRCTGCLVTSLDFSPAAFQTLASEDVGLLVGMTWVWD